MLLKMEKDVNARLQRSRSVPPLETPSANKNLPGTQKQM
jgi:hypothetical protein